jgi:hypothetical protein
MHPRKPLTHESGPNAGVIRPSLNSFRQSPDLGSTTVNTAGPINDLIYPQDATIRTPHLPAATERPNRTVPVYSFIVIGVLSLSCTFQTVLLSQIKRQSQREALPESGEWWMAVQPFALFVALAEVATHV